MMRESFPFFVALRYFFSPKSTRAVNVIAWISVASIALVTLAMIVVLSVFNGFESFTTSQLSSLSPSYLIDSVDGKTFKASSFDIPGAVPILESDAVAVSGANAQPVRLVGVDEEYTTVVQIAPKVYEGEWDLGNTEVPGAVIGIGVAANLGTGVGYAEPIEIILPKRNGRISPVMPQRGFISKKVYVGGVFRADQKEDESTIFLPISTLRNLLDYPDGEVNALALGETNSGSNMQEGTVGRSFDPYSVNKSLPKGFVLKDKVQQHPEIFRVLNIEKWVSLLLLFFVLILSLFSVVSTLGVLIIEKREDASVLNMLGASQKLVDKILLFESWLLSISGVIVGMTLGVALVLLQAKYGWLKLGNGDSFLLEAYPVELHMWDIFLVSVVVLLVGWFSSKLAYLLFQRRIKGAVFGSVKS